MTTLSSAIDASGFDPDNESGRTLEPDGVSAAVVRELHADAVLLYLAGVLGGSLASLVLMPGSGLGASAGVLGLAGYLIILGYRKAGSFPKWLRHRLLLMLGATAISGLAGFFSIDNAAHAGGVLAGTLVAVVTIPRRSISQSAASARVWDAVGWGAAAILVAGALFTVARLMQVL